MTKSLVLLSLMGLTLLAQLHTLGERIVCVCVCVCVSCVCGWSGGVAFLGGEVGSDMIRPVVVTQE
jgi:hypothetical protein